MIIFCELKIISFEISFTQHIFYFFNCWRLIIFHLWENWFYNIKVVFNGSFNLSFEYCQIPCVKPFLKFDEKLRFHIVLKYRIYIFGIFKGLIQLFLKNGKLFLLFFQINLDDFNILMTKFIENFLNHYFNLWNEFTFRENYLFVSFFTQNINFFFECFYF